MYKKAELGAYIESANYIKSKYGQADIAVILGSGLDSFADDITENIIPIPKYLIFRALRFHIRKVS